MQLNFPQDHKKPFCDVSKKLRNAGLREVTSRTMTTSLFNSTVAAAAMREPLLYDGAREDSIERQTAKLFYAIETSPSDTFSTLVEEVTMLIYSQRSPTK